MANRPQEQWGGEVHPRWLRRLLRRPEPLGDSREAARERRGSRPTVSVAQNADRAAVGPLSDLYYEGRGRRR